MKYLQANKQSEIFQPLHSETIVTRITYKARKQFFNQLHIENYKKFTPYSLLF
jgi:hypothetical protein